ncbi:hypothetical protein B0H19DRAFT_1263540 [Mycena capillaripes]|nr:hypothetical protein B0H19DRAFT_1263540 [Mycena capillaripes]
MLTPNFPWRNLTNLDLTSPLNYVEIRTILVRCISLYRCHLNGINTSSARLRGDPTMHTLSALEMLRIQTTTVGPSCFCFEVFTLPNLRHLDTNLFGWTAEPLPRALAVRIDQSSPAWTLKFLQLHDFPSKEVIVALRYHPGQTSMATLLFPALKELWIEVESEELAARGDDLV